MSPPARPQPTVSFGTKLKRLFDSVPPKASDEDRKHRRKRSFSDEELAAFVREYTGKRCSTNYIGKLKADKSPPPPQDFVEAIATFFSMPPAYFFDDELSAQAMTQLEMADELAAMAALFAKLKTNEVLLRELERADPADLPAAGVTLRTLREHRESITKVINQQWDTEDQP